MSKSYHASRKFSSSLFESLVIIHHCRGSEGSNEHCMLLSVNLTGYSEANLQNMTLFSECALLLSGSSNLLHFKTLLTPRSRIASHPPSRACPQARAQSGHRQRDSASNRGRGEEGSKRRRSLWWSGASAPLQGTGCGFSCYSVICVCAQFALLHITQTHTPVKSTSALRVMPLPSVDLHIQSS